MNNVLKLRKIFNNKYLSIGLLEGIASGILHSSVRELKVSYDLSGDSYANEKGINISVPDMFFDQKYSDYFRIVVTRALLVHECQHINSTPLRPYFNKQSEIASWYKSQYGGDISKFLDAFFNIVEDGRIERIAISNHPGYDLNFRILNGEIRSGCEILNKDNELKDFMNQLLSYCKTREDAVGVDIYNNTRLQTEWFNIRPLLDEALNSNSAQKCFDCLENIIHLLSDYISTFSESTFEELSSFASSISSGLDVDQELEQYDNNGNNSSGKKSRESQNQNDNKDGTDNKDSTGIGNDNCNESNKDIKSKYDKKSSNKNGNNTKKDNNKLSNGYCEKFSSEKKDVYSKKEIEEIIKKVSEEVKKIITENAIINSAFDSRKIRPKKENIKKKIYNSCVLSKVIDESCIKQATRLRKNIMYLLKNKKRVKFSRKTGILDNNSLWKTKVNNPRIFKDIKKPADSISITLLIDNSGSMSSASKYVLARRAASIVEFAFSDYPLRIVLFNSYTCKEIEHNVIKDFYMTSKKNFSYSESSIFNKICLPSGGNRDGSSIRYEYQNLLETRSKKKYLIVLSDGLPSAYSTTGDVDGIEDTKMSVREARSNCIEVISIPFIDVDDSFDENIDNFKRIYSKNIVMSTIDNLDKVLVDVFKDIVL